MKKKLMIKMVASIITSTLLLSVPVYAEKKEEVNAATEEAFLQDLKTALEKRWEISDSKDPDSLSSEEAFQYYTDITNAEYDILKEYEDCTFDNAKFDTMVKAYVDAIKCQSVATKYYTTMNNVYSEYWSAGYYVRAILLPDFVDYYGLEIDESHMKDFRDTKAAVEAGTTYTTVTTTVEDTTNTSTDNSAIDTSGVNMGEEESVQTPIEIYNDDGIKVTITKYEKTQYGSAKLTMDVVNLNHKDISISSADYSIVINGTSVNLSPFGEIQSGKTGTAVLEFYPDQIGGIAIEDIKSIDFKLAIYNTTNNQYNLKAESGDIYLNVNGNIVTQRVVYTDKENIQKVQQLLTSLGYNSGSTDGVPGKLTNSAILQFQKDRGLAENTDITPELIAELEKAAQQ
ncbi:MAG: peptidoglycan-binding domain-containing protein [Blautia sp.]|uniref:peptidoglycan-binding domain-containing protein n=1 Tax=Blautia sp. TaxID=1955243 RepID=UPI002A749C9B|nr:peptidoglycan-binding domain-containing protein [Blautia sp.]MDY3015911.1 peptidoglycan-binding domain-containing protein [Blautia sp.]